MEEEEDGRQLGRLRAKGEEGGELAARAFMGEHRGFPLELFYRADETGREGRGAGDVEGKPGRGGAIRRERQPRFLQRINKRSAHGRYAGCGADMEGSKNVFEQGNDYLLS